MFSDPGSIYRAKKDQANMSADALATGQKMPFNIVVDAKCIYFSNNGSGMCDASGSIVRRSKVFEETAITVVASGQKCPSNFATDSTSIYWGSDKTIYRLATW